MFLICFFKCRMEFAIWHTHIFIINLGLDKYDRLSKPHKYNLFYLEIN